MDRTVVFETKNMSSSLVGDTNFYELFYHFVVFILN